MKEALLNILREIRPDVDFETETGLVSGEILESFDLFTIITSLHDELGVALVMGNFGTRNTNIPLLYQVHFDLLELDKSFAARVPQDDMACRAVVAIQHMADTLNLNVCAKGIANQEQFEFFEEIGIFKGQGPLIGPAMPLSELKEYVKRYGLEKGHGN